MNKDLKIKILRELVEVFERNGVKVETPYDIENFMEDHGRHEDFFECGKFNHLIDDEIHPFRRLGRE